MKNKFIVLTLCFTIIFSNINLNNYKSYAYNSNDIEPLVFDGGVISAPMLATVSALAVGTGIVIKESDDIYDLGRLFYNYIDNYTDMTWDFVNSAFLAGHTLINECVQVDSNFLDIVKGFFDNTFSNRSDNIVINNHGLVSQSFYDPFEHQTVKIGDYSFTINTMNGRRYLDFYYGNTSIRKYWNFNTCDTEVEGMGAPTHVYCLEWFSINVVGNGYYIRSKNRHTGVIKNSSVSSLPGSSSTIDFPYTGGYTWDNVDSKKENESVSLPIPGDLGTLVGQGSTDFWDNADGLVGNGSISLPGVSNPSIDVTDDVFVGSPSTDIPGVGNPSVPGEGIWATIKDFVVSLVVPSDTFWTDTFNGFRDNFSKNFPMLDMSKFDSLAVGGKPFPNLYAYGSKIVDGDVINSIVDWLRPIIAGFIMICLMFFNYRKIYKLIRNTEPFGSIAQGSSDFRTGLSAPPINNGLDSNPMGNLRDTLFDMRNEILRRENAK